MLELINRFRTDPGDELPLLLNSDDPDIQNALRFFNVDENRLHQQWNQLKPVPPLAWNEALTRAARGHNARMLASQRQSHQLPGEPPLQQRAAAAGYRDAAFVGENIFAFTESIEHGHAGFAIDWGNGPNGIQDPPGHRDNYMSGLFSEVGISVIDAPRGKNVGPLLVTQDFGSRRNQTRPFLTGVLYDDRNGDKAYTPGEGLGGCTVIATGDAGTFTTAAWQSGGYQLQLPPGKYTVVVSGWRNVARIENVVIADDNVKRDFTRSILRADTATPTAGLSVSHVTSGDAPAAHTFTVTYSDDGAVAVSTLGQGDVRVTGPNGFDQIAQFVGLDRRENGLTRTATYRITAPGGFFDGADNGTYTVSTRAGEVTDTNRNPLPVKTLGTFNVNTPLVTLLANGTYILNGTSGHDSMSLSLNGQTLVGRVNNFIYTSDYRRVKRIFVAGLGGNDTIAIARDVIGSVVDGGPGNDVLRGSNGNDTIQGQLGDDLLDGAAGNDTFRGGDGRDSIDGGKGVDRAERDKRDVLTQVEALFG